MHYAAVLSCFCFCAVAVLIVVVSLFFILCRQMLRFDTAVACVWIVLFFASDFRFCFVCAAVL